MPEAAAPSKHGWRQRIEGATLAAGLLLVLGLAAGCSHPAKVAQMPSERATAPAARQAGTPLKPQPPVPSPGATSTRPARIAPTPAPLGGVDADDLRFISTHKPILSEVGLATWYTAAKGRKAANGQLFTDNALTAAHRTLPMGSLLVVTNMATGQSSAMRVTDRGPFIEGNLLDLSIASAKATGIYRVGTASVRMDVYRTPKPIESGGHWCVQIGAFSSEEEAIQLKAKLLKKYPDANVIEFPGEASYWVRIRPLGDNREQAEEIVRHLHPNEGAAFLTRLD